jgi:hypothetical protein
MMAIAYEVKKLEDDRYAVYECVESTLFKNKTYRTAICFCYKEKDASTIADALTDKSCLRVEREMSV